MSEIPQTPSSCNIRRRWAQDTVIDMLALSHDRSAQKRLLLTYHDWGIVDTEQTERFMRTFGLRSA